ncbi:hypothetical protein [Companilactobacillus futsaii]|uniref:Uncharacterized protein n=2 Tax=Companilactobacillus futsaii TaxID=938155 RepID=A0A5B7SVQ0_9LACO|nr:hypothetical protein [Companilactobacillus futsaii]QCX23757.1 hypothetical protein FG051_00960 [Companilactobacillus futsaii]
MQIGSNQDSPLGPVLFVPLMVEKQSELQRIIMKSTTYFFLEPQEFRILKEATLGSLKDIKVDEYVVGVWKNSDGRFIVTSIYRNNLYQHSLLDFGRIGDIVTGLPDDFQQAERFFIE